MTGKNLLIFLGQKEEGVRMNDTLIPDNSSVDELSRYDCYYFLSNSLIRRIS